LLKIRIIPTLLWKSPGLVKGVSFDSWRRVGTILPSIKVYNTRQVDELILVDISASIEKTEPDFDLINEISAECFIPLTVGGGVNNISQIKQLLRSGADKISINTAAYENPLLIEEASRLFGNQCIVISIDAIKHGKNEYECFSHSGTRPTGEDLITWVRKMEELGAGEVLITSIENDGTMKGYDIDMIKSVTDNVKIPVIASGGAGNYLHMYDAIHSANASAVAAASIFHFTQQTPLEAKKYLKNLGVNIRI
jgi:cyclase